MNEHEYLYMVQFFLYIISYCVYICKRFLLFNLHLNVQLSMIVDTYSKKYIVKLYISNFHFVGAEGDGKMKI